MRRADDVFFFTLIDFLIQVFFFGLLLYVAMQARDAKYKDSAAKTEQRAAVVSTWAGFSTLTELTDFLSKLAPPSDFRGWADFMSKSAPLPEVKGAVKIAEKAGGLKPLEAKLKKYDETFGLPPCEKEVRNGKTIEIAIATLRLEDQQIVVTSQTPEFSVVLAELGATANSVERLSLLDFRKRFGPLRRGLQECVHYVDIEVRTALLAPMDALLSGFRYRYRR